MRLLIVNVNAGSTVHADTQGRSWHRVNTSCLPLTPADQARISQERSGFDWSAQNSRLRLGDVSSEALLAARTMLRRLPDDRRQLAAYSNEDFLAALGVTSDRVHLTEAGRLLFCEDASAWNVIAYQYKATPGGEPRTVQRLSPPMLTAFGQVMQIIAARQSTTPVAMPNGQQMSIEDFPTIAVREALSNALCHRDWQASEPIAVDHSPEVFSVTSPGPLVSGVTPENILTMPSRPRNRCLATAARTLGLAEETGRGVDRMFRETIRSGRQPPNIEAFPDRAKVSFVGGAPDTNIARFVARLPDDEREDTDTMLLLYHLCRRQTVNSENSAVFLQKSAIESEAVLRRLAAEPANLLETTRHSRSRSRKVYRLRGDVVKGLGAAVTYNRRTVDETDRKIIEHVREYGKITNRTLQNLFDVHVYRARDLISSLQQRGLLARTSEQSRGPRVEWGPGPGFPKGRKAAAEARLAALHADGEQSELPLRKPEHSTRER